MSGSESRRIHMIGTAHIDPAWLWQWPEGYQEVRATFQSAVDRLDEYPEYVFTCDSVLYFSWIEESDPALFARIREKVAEGRFEVVGGWWIEPDCNLPCGESFVRQALYGQRFLHEKLGLTATVGSNLDPFGHHAQIPQILAKSGCDSYVFQRPGPNEKELVSPLFRWESPDGSHVVAYRLPHEFESPKNDISGHLEQAIASLPKLGRDWAVFYGVGNHGGGPTRANIEQIRQLNDGEGPRLEPSSLRTFFDEVEERGLPTIRGELQHFAPGCYTSHSGIKRLNRRAENLLLRAEKWAVIADRLGLQAYPYEALTRAWKLLLLTQFHDTLGGVSIEPVYEDARDQIGHASSLAASAFNAAVQSIACRIRIDEEPEMRPIVVFNPHPWRLRTDVEVEYTWPDPEGMHVVDDDGRQVAMQLTRPLSTVYSPRTRLAFAVDLPPLGWRVYRVRHGTVELPELPGSTSSTRIENDHLRLELDPLTGRIAKLVVKGTGLDLARAEGRHAVIVDDHSDSWGIGVESYDAELGEFECTGVRLLEQGPVRAILRVESRFGSSTLREDYVLSAGARHVDVRVTLDWHETLRLLKLRYPTSVDTETATFEIPYGHLERAAGGLEEPSQSWVDVSDGSRGLAVLSDAKYGYDVRGGDIGVSAVRSPVWAWHSPRELEGDGDFEYMDQGRQRFVVRLVPHAGDWRAAEVVRRACELNQPPFALIETYHDGPLEQRASFAEDAGAVAMTVLKRGEEGGLVVRAYETAGRAAGVTLDVLGRKIVAEFGAHEIKTFHLHEDGVREVNLLEWN